MPVCSSLYWKSLPTLRIRYLPSHPGLWCHRLSMRLVMRVAQAIKSVYRFIFLPIISAGRGTDVSPHAQDKSISGNIPQDPFTALLGSEGSRRKDDLAFPIYPILEGRRRALLIACTYKDNDRIETLRHSYQDPIRMKKLLLGDPSPSRC